jgi:hypothetical protein
MNHKRLVNVILGLLVIQFLLGMLANLYAEIPQPAYEVFHQAGYITFHALNGTLLVVLGIILIVKSRKEHALKLPIAGLASMLFAYTFGELFVFTQYDLFSFLMSVGFIGALLSYARLAFAKNS